jgi:hypothetical protein
MVIESTVRWSNFDRRDPKMGVFWQSTEATPCGHLLKWKLTPENPPRTPCSWPPWPWFSHERLLKHFKVLKKIQKNVDPHFKNVYLARKWIWRAHVGLVWKLDSRATHSVLQKFWLDNLLGHSKAMNKPQKKFKRPWKIKVSSTSSKFCLCASLKSCDLQNLRNA